MFFFFNILKKCTFNEPWGKFLEVKKNVWFNDFLVLKNYVY